MSAGHQAKNFHSSRRKVMTAVACSSGRWAYTRTVFFGSVGWTWCVIVSLSILKSLPNSFVSLRFASGNMLLSVNMEISFSCCRAPNVSETLWKSRSHWSDLVKLPLTMMIPAGPGILSLRYGHELCERWSPEYGVILRLPVEHFEHERLLCEVAVAAKDH